MPTPKKKPIRKRTTTQNFMNDSAAEAEVEAAVAEDVPEIQVASVEGEETNEPVKVVGNASVKNSKLHEIVTVTVFEDMNPAPVIGKYDFRKEKRISILTKGKHEVPFFVAEVLVDKGKATM